MELDHIVPQDDGGGHDIKNAIPVCFDCHAEIHHYNTSHPKGRRFRPAELRAHKKQWLSLCKKGLSFSARSGHVQAGPLEAMVDELDFNRAVAAELRGEFLGCPFNETQFRRAVSSGSIALLAEKPRHALLDAYVAIGRANHCLQSAASIERGSDAWAVAMRDAQAMIGRAAIPIEAARTALLDFLGIVDTASAPVTSAATPILSVAEGYRRTARGWRNQMIAALQASGGAASGQHAYYTVPPAELPCAEWAVNEGLFEWSAEAPDRLVLSGTEEVHNEFVGLGSLGR